MSHAIRRYVRMLNEPKWARFSHDPLSAQSKLAAPEATTSYLFGMIELIID